MIAEAGFLFSIAALNASFAGLGGLLIGLRRGSELRPLDALRLRQVVEFAFTNLLIAISVLPFAALIGPDAAIRLSSLVSLACILVVLPILRNRVARVDIEWGRSWAAFAIGLSAIGAAPALVTVISPLIGLFELLLVVMLSHGRWRCSSSSSPRSPSGSRRRGLARSWARRRRCPPGGP